MLRAEHLMKDVSNHVSKELITLENAIDFYADSILFEIHDI
jgi:hypothetical protein